MYASSFFYKTGINVVAFSVTAAATFDQDSALTIILNDAASVTASAPDTESKTVVLVVTSKLMENHSIYVTE
jgi:hypothetical protein